MRRLKCDDGDMPPATEYLLARVRRLCMASPEVSEGVTHGGETWFTSKENDGSTFYFSLPITDALPPPPGHLDVG